MAESCIHGVGCLEYIAYLRSVRGKGYGGAICRCEQLLGNFGRAVQRGVFEMIFGRVRAHFKRKRLEHQRPVIAQHVKILEDIYRRRFEGTDKDRFEFLWCEIAEVCRVRPEELHEDDQISDRCPGRQGWLSSDTRLDDLEFVIMSESREMPPPRTKPQTIGEVLDYLLQSDVEDED